MGDGAGCAMVGAMTRRHRVCASNDPQPKATFTLMTALDGPFHWLKLPVPILRDVGQAVMPFGGLLRKTDREIARRLLETPRSSETNQ